MTDTDRDEVLSTEHIWGDEAPTRAKQMTQKNEAPERIWAWPWNGKTCRGSWRVNAQIGRDIGGTEYIRADHAQAELQAAVAVEREKIAAMVEGMDDHEFVGDDGGTLWCPPYQCDVANAIRARPDTDAQAALADHDAQVREAALREAAEAVAILPELGNAGHPQDSTDRIVDAQIRTDRDAILALIERDQSDE